MPDEKKLALLKVLCELMSHFDNGESFDNNLLSMVMSSSFDLFFELLGYNKNNIEDIRLNYIRQFHRIEQTSREERVMDYLLSAIKNY